MARPPLIRISRAAFSAGLLCICGSLPALDWQAQPGYRVAPLPSHAGGKSGFTKLAPAQTGITFTNLLTPEDDIKNQNLMNGSGLALGDVDGDGWCDIYFCNLNGTNRLFRNLGNWKFQDVTAESGVGLTNQLTRAAVLADVDGDGDLDLVMTFNGRGARLFLNDGQGHFTEDTQNPLSPKRGGTSIALGDLDGNGSLDLYVANYGENTILRGGGNFAVRMVNGKPVVSGRYATRLKIIDGKMVEWGEVDDVYFNDGRGRFTPVSWTDGHFRTEDGQPLPKWLWDYGLSVQIRDLNQDGHPDIYVCNDFHTPDRLWINDGKGHFQLLPRLAMRTISYASMGVDFGDLDRDGWLDIMDVEMQSRSHLLKLTQLSGVNPEFPVIGELDNRPLIPRNTMFWNRGDGTYAEIANYAGTAASDWTWSPNFLDVDLDGYEDMLVVNGHFHDVNDMDRAGANRGMGAGLSLDASRLRLLDYPPLVTPNIAWRNRHDLTFEDVSEAWGFNAPDISHGLAFADLDHDGDLDVVINCLNTGALVYRNDASAPRVAVRLKGKAPNTQGINATVKVLGGPAPQFQEILSGSRYLCGDDPIRVFAAGQAHKLAIEVTWRSGARSVISNALPNCIYEVEETGTQPVPAPIAPPAARPWFRDVSDKLGHKHQEEPFDDFARQPLLPWRLSQPGPGISWADLDGDGLDDLLITTGKGGQLGIYKNDGSGNLKPLGAGAVADRDLTTALALPLPGGGSALLVAAANYEDGTTNGEAVLRYEFQGGQWVLAKGLAMLPASVGPLALADLDGDGDLDLFVGGRVVPGRYPEAASSYIFRNTAGQLALDPANSKILNAVGLVSGAVFSDLNGDGYPDLVLACEWGPVRVFFNRQGVLAEGTTNLGLAGLTGWWRSVAVADLDGDGRLDLIAGNWGMNSVYHASPEHPVRLYYGDFNAAGSLDLVEAYSDLTPGKIVPRRPLDTLAKGLPFVREKFTLHRAFAEATVAEILGDRYSSAREVQAVTLKSMIFLNRGDTFAPAPLIMQAQWAPVSGISVADFNGDGHADVFLAQNFFATQLGMPRLDAGRGLLLQGDGLGGLTPVRGQDAGILVYGEQRGAAAADYDGDGRVDLAVSQNGTTTKLFHNQTDQPGVRVRLRSGPENPAGIGASLRVLAGNQAGPRYEIHAGSGYCSADSSVLVLKVAAGATIEVRWPGGATETVVLPPDSREVEITRSAGLKKIK